VHQFGFSLHDYTEIYGQQNIKFRRVPNFAIRIQYSFHHEVTIISENKNEKKYFYYATSVTQIS
jgi:hypothetical protein